jgi:DNA-binding MarR family transcriptional regulator
MQNTKIEILNSEEVELITALSCTDEIRIENALKNISSHSSLTREGRLFKMIRSNKFTREAMQKASSSWIAKFRAVNDTLIKSVVSSLEKEGLVDRTITDISQPRCTASDKRELSFLYRYLMTA